MAGTDRRIDPETGDYIADGSGGYETTRSAETSVYHQIKGNLGQWAGDPAAGARFFELERASSTLLTPLVVRDMTEEALSPLVAAGLVAEPEIVTERSIDRVAQESTITDLQSGEDMDLSAILPSVV